MGFNTNPHVAKATAAEQKAQAAGDESARTQAWFEAARQWERAAEREKSEKKASEYRKNAETARAEAEGPAEEPTAAAAAVPPPAVPPGSWN